MSAKRKPVTTTASSERSDKRYRQTQIENFFLSGDELTTKGLRRLQSSSVQDASSSRCDSIIQQEQEIRSLITASSSQSTETMPVVAYGMTHENERTKQYEPKKYAAGAQVPNRIMSEVFDGTSGEVTLDNWLDSYRPSQLSKHEGISWIWVRLPNREVGFPDVIGLRRSWDSLQRSTQPINYQTITEMAKQHEVLSGKWLIYVGTGAKVDRIWGLIARGVIEGRLGDIAKVSPFDKAKPTHLICVYNNNFMNEEEVFQLEKGLRRCGVEGTLRYKPDVYTHLGVYYKNKWDLRPVVYESTRDTRHGTYNVRRL